jgi:CubicO group peptidase (beta-lactamase class C family)
MRKYIYRFASLAVSALLLVSCTNEGTSVQSKVLTEEVKAQLETAADTVYAEVKPPGMIALISVEGESDYIIKRGVSNIETGRPMSEDYYFRIASNTKTFTGLTVLILVDEGKIILDTPIASYLPEYNIPNGNRITVGMLGNMTSGLFNYTDDADFYTPFSASEGSYTYTPPRQRFVTLPILNRAQSMSIATPIRCCLDCCWKR